MDDQCFGLNRLRDSGLRPKEDVEPYAVYEHFPLWRIVDCEPIPKNEKFTLDPKAELSRSELRHNLGLVPKKGVKPIRKRHNRAGTCLYRVADCEPIVKE